MITIARKQMDSIKNGIVEGFKQRLIAHASRHFPGHSALSSHVEATKWVNLGIRRAGYYNIKREYDVCIFVSLMFSHGLDFDIDPALVPISQALKDLSRDATERVELACDLALEHEGKEKSGV